MAGAETLPRGWLATVGIVTIGLIVLAIWALFIFVFLIYWARLNR